MSVNSHFSSGVIGKVSKRQIRNFHTSNVHVEHNSMCCGLLWFFEMR